MVWRRRECLGDDTAASVHENSSSRGGKLLKVGARAESEQAEEKMEVEETRHLCAVHQWGSGEWTSVPMGSWVV